MLMPNSPVPALLPFRLQKRSKICPFESWSPSFLGSQKRSVQSQDSSLQLSELGSAVRPLPGPSEDACPSPGFPPP